MLIRHLPVSPQGEVDFDEFVAFYASTLEAIEQEQKARDAFTKYDVDGSNTLEKHELFQALLDLDLVPGLDLAQKRSYLEEQFHLADSNGDGASQPQRRSITPHAQSPLRRAPRSHADGAWISPRTHHPRV